MATYYSQMMEFSHGDPMHPTSLSLESSPLQKDGISGHLLSKSILMANGMDDIAVTSVDSGIPLDLTWSTASGTPTSGLDLTWSTATSVPGTPTSGLDLTWSTASSVPGTPTSQGYHNLNSIVVTPPPEGPPPPYPYPPWYSLPPVTSSMPTSIPPTTMHGSLADYLYGSSVEYSPISSPGSIENSSSIAGIHEPQLTDDLTYSQSSMAMPLPTNPPSPLCNIYYTETTNMIPATGYEPVMTPTVDDGFGVPKEIKMPQRKGGIQLWQFLNYLLNNPEKKHRDLIEWTTNMHEREFRMLEPESIAIWWGHHKNKPGMTYDKFSRSLRYYYDKGILKKIQGERYVYRFLIDPEVMYHHIGTSDCRPKIKPMPKAAKAAMSKYHKTHSMEFKVQEPRITLEAETLESALQRSTCGSNSLQVISTNLQCSSSTGDLTRQSDFTNITTPLPIKRCRSLENSRTNSDHSSTPFASSAFSAELKVRNFTQAHEEFNRLLTAGHEMLYI